MEHLKPIYPDTAESLLNSLGRVGPLADGIPVMGGTIIADDRIWAELPPASPNDTQTQLQIARVLMEAVRQGRATPEQEAELRVFITQGQTLASSKLQGITAAKPLQPDFQMGDLRISTKGFFVRGVEVAQDATEALKVYEEFTAALKIPSRRRFTNELSLAETERLELMAEEAAEVVQACMKILRHGYESRWPPIDGQTNRQKLTKELGDVCAAMDLMLKGGEINETLVAMARDEKLTAVPQWLHHQDSF
jgi:hypothetical protein